MMQDRLDATQPACQLFLTSGVVVTALLERHGDRLYGVADFVFGALLDAVISLRWVRLGPHCCAQPISQLMDGSSRPFK